MLTRLLCRRSFNISNIFTKQCSFRTNGFRHYSTTVVAPTPSKNEGIKWSIDNLEYKEMFKDPPPRTLGQEYVFTEGQVFCGFEYEHMSDTMQYFYQSVKHGKQEAVQILLDYVPVDTRDSFGNTYLHAAAEHGQLEIIYKLWKHGYDIHARNIVGKTPMFNAVTHPAAIYLLRKLGGRVMDFDWCNYTPLHSAAWRVTGETDAIRTLILLGSPVDLRSNNGTTPLGHSTNPQTAQALIDYGANVHARDIEYRTPLHYLMEVDADAEAVKVLLAAGAEIDAEDFKFETPLGAAARGGNLSSISTLVQNGARIDGSLDRDAIISPLFLAIRMQRADVVELLLKLGAREDRLDGSNISALQWACASKVAGRKIVEMILKKNVHVHHKNRNGDSAVGIAAGFDNIEVLEPLFKKGTHMDEEHHYITRAAYYENYEMIMEFLRLGADKAWLNVFLDAAVQQYDVSLKAALDAGVDPNTINRVGCAPLHYARNMNHVWDLVDAGANLEVTHPYNFLMAAAWNGNLPALEYFVQAGLDVNAVSASPHETALVLAVKKDNLEVAHKLLSLGAKVSLGTPSPIFFARSVQMLELLLDNGADVNASNYEGSRPLFVIATEEAMVDLLLARGADVNAVNYYGDTPLHASLAWCDESIVNKLILGGAQCVANKKGKTPIAIAKERGLLQMEKLLLEHFPPPLDAVGSDVDTAAVAVEDPTVEVAPGAGEAVEELPAVNEPVVIEFVVPASCVTVQANKV